jgi:hypothetical protein
MPSLLLRCQGLAVDDYSVALGRLTERSGDPVIGKAGATSTFAQLGLSPIKSSSPKSPVMAGIKTSKISESDIRNIVKDVLHSTNNRETDRLLHYLAPSYKGTLKTEDEEMSLNRKEYKDYLEDGWSGYGFYRARHEGENINISPDKQKATLETEVIEIASLTDGTTIKLRSQQKWKFAIIDGKILIIGSEAKMAEL